MERATDRGTGRTRAQMIAAPRNALFIWCNGHLSYPRNLARVIGRSDIEIVGPSTLDDGTLRGRRLTSIVLDHAARLNDRQWDAFMDAAQRVQPPAMPA